MLAAVVLVGAAGGIFAAALADTVQPQTVQINIQNFAFTPAQISVPPGTTIVWTNLDDVVHTVISDTGAFASSGQLSKGDSYTLTLTKPGDYRYHCGIHSFMQGVIHVVPPAPGAQSRPAAVKPSIRPARV
ncbi:MAG: cupredoxin domain-containing protein [Gammaproteobacteria bacterium]